MSRAQEQTLALRITPSIAQDFERRGVFSMLRISDKRVEGAVTFRIDMRLAAEVLEDARTQHARAFTQAERGTKKSYLHLIETLRAVLEPDGVEAERLRSAEAVKALRAPLRLDLGGTSASANDAGQPNDHSTNQLMIAVMTEPSQARARRLLGDRYSVEIVQALLDKALDAELASLPTAEAQRAGTSAIDRAMKG